MNRHLRRLSLALGVSGALAGAACSTTQVEATAAALQFACSEYQTTAGDAKTTAKGGALNTVNSITAYGDPICATATSIAQYAADPSNAAFIGGLTQQIKSLVSPAG